MRYNVKHNDLYATMVAYTTIPSVAGSYELIQSITYAGSVWLRNDRAVVFVNLIDEDTVQATALVDNYILATATATIEEQTNDKHAVLRKLSSALIPYAFSHGLDALQLVSDIIDR